MCVMRFYITYWPFMYVIYIAIGDLPFLSRPTLPFPQALQKKCPLASWYEPLLQVVQDVCRAESCTVPFSQISIVSDPS